jgi:hypothetical protein
LAGGMGKGLGVLPRLSVKPAPALRS